MLTSSPRHWRPERCVPIADALDILIDDLEHHIDHDQVELPTDPLPLSCGIARLDRAFGGGIHLGAVTLIEADLPAQARALVLAIARVINHPTLVATTSVLDGAGWLLAGSASVPAICIQTGQLSDGDWHAIDGALPALAERPIWLTATDSVSGLGHVATGGGHLVLLIEDLGRFGPARETVAAIGRLASVAGLAVIATTEPLGDLPEWALESTTRVAMAAHGLGGRAALVNGDGLDGLIVEQIRVACLEARIR